MDRREFSLFQSRVHGQPTAESPAVLVKKSVISWADADDLKCDLETCIFNKHST